MATLDFTKSMDSVQMTDANVVNFGTVGATFSVFWNFLTPTGNSVETSGQNMTFDADGHALTGTVETITLNTGAYHAGYPDVKITGIAAPASSLDDGPQSFWQFLEGNDVFLGPSGNNNTYIMFGDGPSARAGSSAGGIDIFSLGDAYTTVYGDVANAGSQAAGAPAITYLGGNDDIAGLASNRFQSFIGDVREVYASAKVTGGNDSIFIQSSYALSEAIGDAIVVEGVAGDMAELIGGNDYIAAGPFSQARLIGDVFAQRQHSIVRGGADTIRGSNMKEDIVGDVYDIRGGQLIGGNNTIDGGDGADQIFGDVFTSDGQARITGGNDVIHGGENDDYIWGEGLGQAIVKGGNDWLYGDAGSDTIFGQTGDDIVHGGSGDDFLHGGSGNDSLTGGTENDKLYGGDGNDILDGAQGADAMEGGAGNDTYFVNNMGDSVIEAVGQGTDTVWTTLNSATLADNVENLNFIGLGDFVGIGNALDNVIVSGGGGDALAGRDGNDRLSAGGGDDALLGETGNDLLEGGAGADQLDGASGVDTASYAASAGVTADLANAAANTGEAMGDTYAGIENLLGSNFNDSLRGDNLVNTLTGGMGNDVLIARGGNDRAVGGEGADTLYGDAGNDTLDGGLGKDSMSGGLGSDRFDFNAVIESTTSSGRDVIRDFTVDPDGGAGFVDRIEVATIDAKAGVTGDQAFSFIGTGAFTGEGQIRVAQSGAHTIVQFNTTGAGGAEMEVLLADFNATTPTAADFIL